MVFGYYDQGQRLLNPSNTVFDEMKDAYRLYTDTEMRSILGRFLLSGRDGFSADQQPQRWGKGPTVPSEDDAVRVQCAGAG